MQRTLDETLRVLPEDAQIVVGADRYESDLHSLLSSVDDPRLVHEISPDGLNMVEHWDWLALRATGLWQMFLGQDDALTPFFHGEAERLTHLAEQMRIRAVCSRRAFLVWEGLEESYGPDRVDFAMKDRINSRSSVFDAALATLNIRSYHHLCQAYTSSLVHRSLLQEIRRRQAGRLFATHPQDASLAAAVVFHEPRYLYSHTPLAWVGTSPSSAGLAVLEQFSPLEDATAKTSNLNRRYVESVQKGKVQYPDFAGDFSLGENAVYFWQALVVQAGLLGKKTLKRLMMSRTTVCLVLASVWSRSARPVPPKKRAMLTELARYHHVPPMVASIFGSSVRLLVEAGLQMRFFFRRLGEIFVALRAHRAPNLAGERLLLTADTMARVDIAQVNKVVEERYRAFHNSALPSAAGLRAVRRSYNPLPQ